MLEFEFEFEPSIGLSIRIVHRRKIHDPACPFAVRARRMEQPGHSPTVGERIYLTGPALAIRVFCH